MNWFPFSLPLLALTFLIVSSSVCIGGGEFDLFREDDASTSDSEVITGKPTRGISYSDLGKKVAKVQRGIIWKCRCGHENKITNVRQGQRKRVKCEVCGMSATMVVTMKPMFLVTCPYCGHIEQMLAQVDEGVHKCRRCKREYLVASAKTLHRTRVEHEAQMEERKKQELEMLEEGYVNIEGEWISPQEQTNRVMVARGYKKYKEKWLTKQQWIRAKIRDRDYEGLPDLYGNELAKHAQNPGQTEPYFGQVAKMDGVIVNYDTNDKRWICVTESNDSGDLFAFAFRCPGMPPKRDRCYMVYGIVQGHTEGRVLLISKGGMTKIKRVTENRESYERGMGKEVSASILASVDDRHPSGKRTSEIETGFMGKMDVKSKEKFEEKQSREFVTDRLEIERKFNTVDLSNVVITLID